jgi:endothelin-converting enzyme/putative endopeptidase
MRRIFLACSLVLLTLTAVSQQPYTPLQKSLRVFDPSILDKSVDPCVDFYKFSCNGWLKANPLPADQVSYGRFTELAELNRARLRTILESVAAASTSRTANEQKIGDEYASCMNVAGIEQLGTKPFQPELDLIAALTNRKQLPALLAHLHQIGVSSFFAPGSTQDLSDATQMIAELGATGLGLPDRDYYFRTDEKSVETRRRYVEHVVKMLQLSGESQPDAKRDADAVLALETRLAKSMLTNVERRDPKNLDNPTTLDALRKLLTSFDLDAYGKALQVGNVDGKKINIEQPKALSEFNAIAADTDLAVIRAYLRWHLLHAVAGTSSPKVFDDENFDFYSHFLRGQQKPQDRWKRCTTLVDRELGEALGQVYVAKYFPPEAKQKTLKMTLAIERAMGEDLDALDWMSAETKVRAKEKLHTVVNKIGYPDKWRDYSGLSIVRGDSLGNQLRARSFNLKRELDKIGKPTERGEWDMTPPTVNAYYNPQMNDVNFPAGYLQPPFFSALEDEAANYGDMGSTIGHELTHGFDDEGRHFDANGNLKEWWTAEDSKKFEARADCVVKQYDAVEPVPGVHINGKLTLGENIADIGGNLLAWMAWLEEAKAAHVNMNAKLDGYTPAQRFWIANAQQWCTNIRPENLRNMLYTNPHAPEDARTNLPLQDSEDFAKAFGCKKGSPMAPVKTCKVW